MKFPVYALRDVKVGFTNLTTDQNDDSARRGFAHALSSSSSSIMGFAPADFSLYRIGEFDIDTGILIPETVPVLVAQATELMPA